MAEIMGAFAPKKMKGDQEIECVCDVRAEIVSLGGAIMFGICILLAMSLFMVLMLPGITALQIAIVFILTLISWIYLFDSCTERLRLVGRTLHYSAAFSRKRIIPLNELDAMILMHEGFNLERGMESIEFRRRGKKPDRIALGPCWQRNKLEAFLHSVEQALQDPHLLGEVR